MPGAYEVFTWLLRALVCFGALTCWGHIARSVNYSYIVYCTPSNVNSQTFYGKVLLNLGGYGVALSMILSTPMTMTLEIIIAFLVLIPVWKPKHRIPKKKWMAAYNSTVLILSVMLAYKTYIVISYLSI
ncbi:hypothetical protein [Vibrio phage BONAISHI]|nr:hypothetical protein [Vibrio phage BONAISHI]